MGETGKESYNSEVNWRVVSKWLSRERAECLQIEADLTFEDEIVWHLEERQGSMTAEEEQNRRDDIREATTLVLDAYGEDLKKFSNDIIESEMAEEYAEYAKKVEWEQLPLWSQSELDQI